jgi:hypothetical protein
MRFLGFVSIAFVLCSFAEAQEGNLSRLPARRVVLYKNGVGYFEHVGVVKGDEQVAVTFTTGQLNDVLKSLTVLDLDGGRVKSVSYDSAAPIERQIQELRLAPGQETSLTEFLKSLRGAKLEVRSPAGISVGRLLSVERKTRTGSGATLEVDYLSLVTDTGEVKTTEVGPGFSVKLLERNLTGRVERFLDLLSSNREPDTRRLLISTNGTGDRKLFVSYVSEVPVWKTTYRILLPSKPKEATLLQGWAIVDNTVGQDWENVELSLVAGAPHSFIQNLSQPFFSRRPVVPLKGALNEAPQTFDAPVLVSGGRIQGRVVDPTEAVIAGARAEAFDRTGNLVGSATTDMQGNFIITGVPDGQLRVQVESPGFRRTVIPNVQVSGSRPANLQARLEIGNVSESTQVTAGSSMMENATAAASLRRKQRDFGGAAEPLTYTRPDQPTVDVRASAQELGDLFEYKLKEPVTIRKSQSALVPILQSSMPLEKVSVWNGEGRMSRPLRSVLLHNNTEMSLEGGSFSVLEDGALAGEGIFELIRPGEKRLVSYASDLALTATLKIGSESQRRRYVRVSNGTLEFRSEIRETRSYTLRNEDKQPRSVIIEHPVRSGYELIGDVKPYETTPGWMRFRLSVPPKESAVLAVQESRPVSETFGIFSLRKPQLEMWSREGRIDADLRKRLDEVIARKEAVEALKQKEQNLDAELGRIRTDQERIRENMQALKGSVEEKALLKRYVQTLDSQEDRLKAVEAEKAALDQQIEKAEGELEQLIKQLRVQIPED